jgi:circadian clock protein KaiB
MNRKPPASPRSKAPAKSPGAPRRKKANREPEYLLRLFVSGTTPRSRRAIDNLQRICDQYLAGRYRIEVIDLQQSPAWATEEEILATPTLMKVRPRPPKRVIGDLSQLDRVLHGLEIGEEQPKVAARR